MGLGLNLLLVLAECYTPHANTDAAVAARIITRGRCRRVFWGGVVVGWHLLPALLVIPASGAPAAGRRSWPSSASTSGKIAGCGRDRSPRSAEGSNDAATCLDRAPPPGGAEPDARRRAASRATRPSSAGTTGPSRTRRPGRERVERRYKLVPTICFNCEAACGLLAYVDKETLEIRKFEGNPAHPGSRGRNCAKGPATLNQINDPERILLSAEARRAARRGQVGARHLGRGARRHRRRASGRRSSRAGATRSCTTSAARATTATSSAILQAWGVDGHNTHTNICSARRAPATRSGAASTGRRPTTPTPGSSCCSRSHLETGHYFNPHAQRIIEGKMRGREALRRSTRGSRNTASMADWWLSPWPGTEAAMLLAMCQRDHRGASRYDREFVRRWVNWEEYLRRGASRQARRRSRPSRRVLTELYAEFTPEFAERESRRPGRDDRRGGAARPARAGSRSRPTSGGTRRPATSAAGRSRAALQFLDVLTGSVGTRGRHRAHRLEQVRPARRRSCRRPPKVWNELLCPREYPLAYLRDELPAAALPQGGARQARRRTSRASTTRCGRTPTASSGSRCCATRRRSGCTSR